MGHAALSCPGPGTSRHPPVAPNPILPRTVGHSRQRSHTTLDMHFSSSPHYCSLGAALGCALRSLVVFNEAFTREERELFLSPLRESDRARALPLLMLRWLLLLLSSMGLRLRRSSRE